MKYASDWRYKQKVRLILLGAGMNGIPFYDLNQKSRTKVFTQQDLEELINEWETRDWVQVFNPFDPTTKRRKKVVRATTLLRDEWSNLRIEGELATDPVETAEDASQP